jgi:acyl-CoA dehydrogenase
VPALLTNEARLIAQLSAQYSLTADLAMGLLGGQLKRMELVSARLGDVLAHLYIASACVWRYQVDSNAELLPFAQAGIRQQLHEARTILADIHANLPSPAERWMALLGQRGFKRLAPLRDQTLLALAETLRTRPDLIQALCPDLCKPQKGGVLDLMETLALAAQLSQLGEDTTALNKSLRRTRSMQTASLQAKHPILALRYLRAAERVIGVDSWPTHTSVSEPDAKNLAAATQAQQSGR